MARTLKSLCCVGVLALLCDASWAQRGTAIRGSVSAGRNRPIVGATVLARPAEGAAVHVTTTDQKGTFRLNGLADGDYEILVQREGYEPISKQNVELRYPFRAIVELTMNPRAGETGAMSVAAREGEPVGEALRLSGRVVTPDGGPLEEASIRLVHAAGGENPRSAYADAAGEFVIEDLPGGTWRVELLGAGYLPIRLTLDLVRDSEFGATMVSQPTTYEALPLDLMPPEEPYPPPMPE